MIADVSAFRVSMRRIGVSRIAAMRSTFLVVCLPLLVSVGASPQTIRVDPKATGLPFDGHGGLSAGASSRLLYDYDEEIRSDILDYLYKPKFGANLHICKVEIGGDTQSTDGTEPSHMHSADDLNCTRGYEWWLMKEAKKRNPDVITYGLSWGAPAWVGDQHGYYSDQMINYQVNWVDCARDFWGIEIDYLGLWNERPWGTASYVTALRRELDKRGHRAQLVLGDGGMPDIWSSFGTDKTFTDAFSAVGLHYPCNANSLQGHGQQLIGAGKKVWSSEDWWSESEFGGAVCWAKLFNQNFIRNNMTSTIAWSTIWSVYPKVDTFEGSGDSISGDGFWGPGLIYAWQPWSGHYVVPPTVWASAHTNQFAAPGWTMLFSSAVNLDAGGSALAMVSPTGTDFSIVLETGKASCAHCAYGAGTFATQPQLVTVELVGPLATHSELLVWHTNTTHSFVQGPSIATSNGSFQLLVLPESIYTVTSTTGQSKGTPKVQPGKSSPFPAKWADDFEGYPLEQMARFWADQCGSFQVVRSRGGAGKALQQQATAESGVNRWVKNLDFPLTVLGDWNSTDSDVKVSVILAPLGTNTEASNFTCTSGRIVGGQYDHAEILNSLKQAEDYCISTPECNSFTFASTQKDPTSSQQYWFSSNSKVSDNSTEWQSCLLTPPRPAPQTPSQLHGDWAALCTRLTHASMGQHIGATCLAVNYSHWQVVEWPSRALGGGELNAGSDPTAGPVELQIQVVGILATASVDGHVVGSYEIETPIGMFGLATGWNQAQFDSFEMNKLP